ncbi:MAG: isocitrate/isopropylmalate dehydrogenase family protein [Acidobacteria bacterium]|nr:isocitrate/isopropylmalate dehydrogenase family protein [Acidobacteriota bacterium]
MPDSGDGIGPEVTEAAVRVVEATGASVQWREIHLDTARLGEEEEIPDDLLEPLRATGAALKGPITTPVATGHRSANVALRRKLNLYANLRPCKSLPGIPLHYRDVDLVVVRENTEGLYSGIEHEVVPGVVESLKIITRVACDRISRFAFEYARREKRKKVTSVHKANIMKMSDGLFLECSRRIAREYPDIRYDEKIIDNVCMQLVLDPGRFDVMLMENLYGDIVSDLCAGLIGGLGLTASANIGDGIAVFETVHGSAPDIAGQGIANPIACILCAAMMLKHLGEEEAHGRIRDAVGKVLTEGRVRTPDLGGQATTREVAEAIAAAL